MHRRDGDEWAELAHDDTLVIGLTGAHRHAARATCCRRLVSLGAEGIDADHVAHEVMAPGGPAYAAVVAAFGPAHPGGRMGELTGRARARGSSATRPRWRGWRPSSIRRSARRSAARVAASTAPVVVIEAIKLLEAGLSRHAVRPGVGDDLLAAASSSPGLQASRGMCAERGAAPAGRQMPAAQMAAQADRVIDTGGTTGRDRRWRCWQPGSSWGLPLPAPEIRPRERWTMPRASPPS